ncbi:dihydrolipoamide acetyltransferase family protein [Amycolatopsis viridis]|uniref:Dihydrolipoamide acetyltransferase component of pyruvate dehydrogenase complex n=1 Tax=Amycolatopsis viridis TaxID=185678 RepID=A0ABX0SKM5_9PSEU|nr:dihydrolipoamide acetyltransferase family protein [Amycolatopsis viridis]NIH77539.1 pyruvate dehydrogenase E2 component (dihydrolipoamide acetyltransferase) [Amycolatopsis viridis]
MPEYKQFLLADTAEGLTEAEILNWRVQPGDEVTVNQIVVEVETAKAAVELPIPWAGVVTELMAAAGDTVAVGAPLLTIDVNPAGAGAPPATVNGSAAAAPAEEEMKPLVGYGSKATEARRRPRKAAAAAAPAPAPAAAEAAPAPAAPAPESARGGYVPLAKPPVRKLAKDLGVDLSTLTGSAEGGVITREDVERAAQPAAPAPATAGARERRVPVRGVRKATAAAMVSSAFTAPHVTEFLTIDVTPMMELRERLKKHPDFAGVKLTPLAFAAKAVCMAVRRTPDVNASWDEAAGEIVYKDYVHLGIAAATPRGLVVPKIRDADAMSLPELARALDELTTTAREGKTPPADMVDGTITITNVGVFGVDTGTPIINPGESAILAFGAIKDAPWVVDGQLAVRKVLQLSLSFDHRLVDGQQGSQFLADVGALLADPAMAFTY